MGYLGTLYQEQTLLRIQTHYYPGERKMWRSWEKSDLCTEDSYVVEFSNNYFKVFLLNIHVYIMVECKML